MGDNKRRFVIPGEVITTGPYRPEQNVILEGKKIISHSSLSWEADINSCYVGMLPGSDVFGRNFQPDTDEMTSKLKKGDSIAARIVNFDRSRDPLITIADRELGKIDSNSV